MNPDRAGQEVWMCHESTSSNGGIGLSLTDARTGARIWTVPGSGDIGRGMAPYSDLRYKAMKCGELPVACTPAQAHRLLQQSRA